MNFTILKFGENEYKAKLGLAVIGNILKEEEITLEEFFALFGKNTPYIAPKLMYYALKKGEPQKSFTLEEVEDMIDEDGGLASPNLEKLILAFTATLQVDKEVGKQKSPVKK